MSELRVSQLKNLAGEDLITVTSLGLENVDNTSDLNKPVSNATSAVIDGLRVNPLGGLKNQALKKASGADGDYTWVDAEVSVVQRGTTLPTGTRTLSRSGGVTEPSTLLDIIPVTSGRSGIFSIRAIARSTSGITKSFTIAGVVKNSTVLSQTSTSAVSETGSGTWTLVLQWSPSLGGYQLFATGSASESVLWESIVNIVEV